MVKWVEMEVETKIPDLILRPLALDDAAPFSELARHPEVTRYMRRIFCRLLQNNAASIRILEKNGYAREGLFKEAVYKNGTFIDQLQYCIYKTGKD